MIFEILFDLMTHKNKDKDICEKERSSNYCYFASVQFPVKWNAFSDRNGMLFSGLTEWLSDTNGMAQ